jgi:eukaryotic-like serine/threonine-protein kinase
MFDDKQESYLSFRDIISERTKRVVVWAGAGLSKPANLPSWPELRDGLCDSLERKAASIEEDFEQKRLYADLAAIDEYPNIWLAFQKLRSALGGTTYRSKIRELFCEADRCSVPNNYKLLWKLPLDGILNLNLDRLATRAHSEIVQGKTILNEFSGKQAKDFVHVLKSTTPFIANLHGTVADEDSWVFTYEELNTLLKNPGYLQFINSCVCARTILFVGITADDIAVKQHLDKLKDENIDFGEHYWITDRSDRETYAWAEEIGIRIINYNVEGSNHSELNEFLDNLLAYIPQDIDAPPVEMESESHTALQLPSPEDLMKDSNENIRKILNTNASSILKNSDEHAYKDYSDFCKKYDQAIYRAWYVTTESPDNMILGYELLEEIKEGAFGRVFRAKDPDGNEFAIKLLKESVRRKPDMLQSFRRGVRSMRILSKHNIDGMVPYHKASEIPAFAVMDFVEGPDLGAAVKSKYCDDWKMVLQIALELSHVIRNAHQLPERVLHRDIRPANIMLKNYYLNPDGWQVVVLDFDLSWHMGATEVSIIDPSTISGYLAPEQIERRRQASTRNAAVDSFGLGMTLYYLRTAIEPQYLQQKHHGWKNVLTETIGSFKCQEWFSLPIRFARLINYATQDKQSDRWDMSQIAGELEQLLSAFSDPTSVQLTELLAEEIAARTAMKANHEYSWNADKNEAEISMLSGVKLDFIPHETEHSIEIRFSWTNNDYHRAKEIGKYLGPRCDQAISILKKMGWKTYDKTVSRAHAGFYASMVKHQFINKLDELAKSLTDAIALLTFE